jgi:hypothetical protein
MTTDNYELKIEEPVVTDLFEPVITPLVELDEDDIFGLPKTLRDRGLNTTWATRDTASNYAKSEGFDAGCIVTRREQGQYQRINPENWGIVISTVSYVTIATGYFAPIKVKWLDGSATYQWPDELIVVNYAPDDIELGLIRRGE